eukprot:1108952-Karenia_brevis.AAC.1
MYILCRRLRERILVGWTDDLLTRNHGLDLGIANDGRRRPCLSNYETIKGDMVAACVLNDYQELRT